MFNTVFKKLLSTYFIIIVVTFLILGLLFSQLFTNYYFDKYERQLLEEGDKINTLVIDYLNGYISRERLNLELQSVERFLNTRIWIIDQRGIIYGVSSEEKKWIGKQITTKDILRVLDGQIIVKKGIYEEVGKTPIVTVGMPIFINGRVDNAIIMHAPLYEITKAIKEVHRIIWTSMAISFIISFMILYLVSKKLAAPIKEMGKVAQKIAAGDFSQRVKTYTDSEDEIEKVIKTFNDMADKLEKIEENRRSFIAAVAHELRSPLTLIKGFVQGMVDGTVEEKDKDKYLNIILRETKRLTQLISNLLDLQKMESDKYPIYPQKFGINELIIRTLIKYEEEIEKKGVKVELNLTQDEMLVWADKDAYEQVLINILENAMKFMKEKGKLQITSEYKHNKVWVKIKDNGIGISKEEQPFIWDRFYKADKSRDRNKNGTGLGLYIVKKIIERHKEEIKVESELGVGTTFIFSLSPSIDK
ncbi:cell wall metabolism sensor histidine kinase WalK [Crassaminicella thermophila]|uniref:histidine kinase n=1 Tax=Crassaminicella thermophila TaxID=2599308 RepID=A0A5C0SF99_CRATE|nr:HAMP domain-containing sensor histidine kinase [Crassaminicella thermophila]QEK13315.1 cell wall metabolism sensor histidine kinase WalK [Crassaminicella thermophila]